MAVLFFFGNPRTGNEDEKLVKCVYVSGINYGHLKVNASTQSDARKVMATYKGKIIIQEGL